jgi:two-component system sensor histidine kinase/response regulator
VDAQQPKSPKDSSPVDIAAALRQVDDDKDLLVELVHAFREDTPVRARALGEALAAGDGTAVARQAHALRGSLSILGAHRAAELGQALETAGHAGDMAQVGTLSAAFVEEVDKVLRVLSDPGWQAGL